MKRLLILNRDAKHPADGWYHIEKAGRHPGVADDGTKILEIVDDQSVASIVSAFNRMVEEYPAKYGTEFPGILIDRDHLSHDESKETAADGWLMGVQNREGELYGKIDWTSRGKLAVDGKDYRFFSTEYPPEGLEILNREGDRLCVRPVALSGLSLTNRPNNVGARPITNRMSPDADPASQTAGKNQKADIQTKETMKKIASKLGLSAEASEDAILEKIQALLDQAKAHQTKEEESMKVENRLRELEAEQIDGLIADAGITDEDKIKTVKPMLGGLKNRAERVDFLKLLKSDKTETTPTGKSPMTVQNRAKTPEGKGDEVKDAKADNARAVRIQNRAAEIRSTSKGRISLSAAYSQAGAQVDAEIAAGK